MVQKFFKCSRVIDVHCSHVDYETIPRIVLNCKSADKRSELDRLIYRDVRKENDLYIQECGKKKSESSTQIARSTSGSNQPTR